MNTLAIYHYFGFDLPMRERLALIKPAGFDAVGLLRDINTLSAAGIPVYTSQGKGGGISILDNFVLNKATVSDEEQNQILLALQSLSVVGQAEIVLNLGVDMLSLSAHKFRRPKGIGALYVKLGRILPPMIIGGCQENNGRSGTENVPSIVGMAAALDESAKNMQENMIAVSALRDKVISKVLQIDGA